MRVLVVLVTISLMLPLLTFGVSGDPPDPFAIGIKRFNQGKYDQAIGMLARAVSAQPNDAIRRLTYGVALANDRRYDQAIAEFREAARLVPDDPVPYFLLEGAYLGKGLISDAQAAHVQASRRLGAVPATAQRPASRQKARAEQAAKPAADGLIERAVKVKAHVDNAILHNLLGDLYQVQGRHAEAVEHYRLATKLAPGWIKPWFNLGMANLVVNPAEAAENFRRVIKLDPKNLQAQLWLGDAYAEQRAYPQALEAYGQAARSPQLEAAARSRSGNVYIKQRELKKAEQEFGKAVKAAPRDPVANAGLADVYRQQQRLPESEVQYKRASDLAGDNPAQQSIIVPNLANVYMEKGDYRKAIQELKRVIAMNPAFPEPVEMLVDAYQRAGLLKEGIAEHEASLSRNPRSTGAMRFLLAAYAAAGDAAKRVGMARRLLKAAPDESEVWNRELGAALVVLGDREDALAAWRRGLESDPEADVAGILPAATAAGMLDDLAAHYKRESAAKKTAAPSLILARIYGLQGDFRRAAEVRRKLVGLYPEKQEYWILLGDDLARAGETADAKAAYTRAAAVSQPGALRALALRRLKELE